MFKPIKQKRVYAKIIDQIKEMVAKGELKPGDRIMSERDLAEELQVSRASIREAFSALDILGILESKPGGGTFIREVPEDMIIEPFSLVFMLFQDKNMEVLEVRYMLETESVALAARRASAGDLQVIKESLDYMEKGESGDDYGEKADASFHLAIAKAAGNRVLMCLMNTVSDLIEETMENSRRKLFIKPENKAKLLKQHKSIYEAIAASDEVAARQAMKEHLEFVRQETE